MRRVPIINPTLLLLLSFCCGKAATEIISRSGEEAVLICPAMAEPQVQYRAISWYKVSAGSLSGILRWDRQRSEVRMFHGFTRPAQCPVSDCLSLGLRNLTCEDGGEYRCTLWAPLGHQSRDGTVHLNIKGCTTVKHLPQDEMLALAPLCVAVSFLVIIGICKISAREKTKIPLKKYLQYYKKREISL